MKTLIRIALLTSLLATPTAGCQEAYIMVRVQVPASLQPTLIRVVQETDGKDPWMTDDRPKFEPSAGGGVEYTVGVPKGAIGSTLIVQAMSDQELLAEGRMTITPAISATLPLFPCSEVTRRTPEYRSCRPAGATPPVATTTDGDEGDAMDGGPMGPTTAATATCVVPDPAASRPSIPPVSMPGDACRDYCEAMIRNCPFVYESSTACLYACETLGWPTGGDQGQDTLTCRHRHATYPATDVPSQFLLCHAARPVLTPACGDRCGVYCRTGAIVCPGAFPPEIVCRTGCEKLKARWEEITRQNPDGSISDDFVEVIGCRMDHLEKAIFDSRYCPVAAPNTQCGGCPYLLFDL
jgi:hypothetical protein